MHVETHFGFVSGDHQRRWLWFWGLGCWNTKNGHQLQKEKPIADRAKEKEARHRSVGLEPCKDRGCRRCTWENWAGSGDRGLNTAFLASLRAMRNHWQSLSWWLTFGHWLDLKRGGRLWERDREHCAFSDLGDQEMNLFNPWNEIKRYLG